MGVKCSETAPACLGDSGFFLSTHPRFGLEIAAIGEYAGVWDCASTGGQGRAPCQGVRAESFML